MSTERLVRIASVALRIALGVGFLFAVADRFGLYGPPGTNGVSWGNWNRFAAYTAKLIWFLPGPLIEVSAMAATLLEIIFGFALIAGRFVSVAAIGSAALLAVFGLTMAISLDWTAPLDFSVFTAAAAALLLGMLNRKQPGISA